MTSREEKRMAGNLADWLEGEHGMPDADPTSRAIARTAVLLVDALAPRPLRPDTRAHIFERALSEANQRHQGDDLMPEVLRVARQVPVPAWVGLGGMAAGVVVGLALFRQREARISA
ncbi:MAG: hypothetical protein ACYCYK_08030 [Candidatus Dormibacteria bacterium]